jgi:hypothetical protein
MIAFDEVAQSERHRAAAHDDGEPALAAEAQSTLYPLRRRGAPAGEANGQAQGPRRPAHKTARRYPVPGVPLAWDIASGLPIAPLTGVQGDLYSVLVWLLREGALMAETRKLAAILAADVAGYSKLAGSDEERTLARLRALRSDLIDPTIALHHGRPGPPKSLRLGRAVSRVPPVVDGGRDA